MKFKIGDRVKLVNLNNDEFKGLTYDDWEEHFNDTGVIADIYWGTYEVEWDNSDDKKFSRSGQLKDHNLSHMKIQNWEEETQ